MRFKPILLLVPLILILVNVTESFADSESFTVQPGDKKYLNFGLNEGDRIKFKITVSGGANDDIVLRIIDSLENQLSEGRIYSNYENEVWGNENGSISFIFDNTISLVSSKHVTFSYEIIQKQSSHMPGGYEGLFFLILIVVSISIGVVAIRRKKKGKQQVHEAKNIDERLEFTAEKEQNEKAMNILKERLAKGEISKEEYDKLKKEFI